MDTHYVDNTGGAIVIAVLIIFLALLAIVCAVFLTGKIARSKADEKHDSDKDEICSGKKDRSYEVRKEEKLAAHKQYANAQITGREKYTAKLRRELDLVGILRWNETRGGNNASAVAELTGGESNTEQLDIASAEQAVGEINRRMVDYSDTARKFDMLDIDRIKCTVTKGGNIEVSCDIALSESPLICGKNAILDGALEVGVYDEKGSKIATGYICAPGFDETDLNKAGFVHCNNKGGYQSYSAMCITDEAVSVRSAEKYKVKIVPYRLWTIAL